MDTGALFLERQSDCGMKLITHCNLELRSKTVELYLHFPYFFMVQWLIN
jgi:hypothetical protein